MNNIPPVDIIFSNHLSHFTVNIFDLLRGLGSPSLEDRFMQAKPQKILSNVAVMLKSQVIDARGVSINSLAHQ